MTEERRRLFGLVTALALLLPIAAADAANAADAMLLDGSGLDPIRIGMPLAEIPVPLKEPIERTMYAESGSCFYVSARNGPRFSMMIEDEKLTRIDVLEPGVKTSQGVSVGDSILKIKKAYGAAVVETPNFYDKDLPDFTVTSTDGRQALRFGTREGRVTSIIAGRASSVAYVEGCL